MCAHFNITCSYFFLSLKAEQLGIIKPGDIFAYSEEVSYCTICIIHHICNSVTNFLITASTLYNYYNIIKKDGTKNIS